MTGELVVALPGSDQVELTFTPFHHRSPLPGTHQCFGHYDGRIRTEDGRNVAVDGLLGWAEQVHMLW